MAAPSKVRAGMGDVVSEHVTVWSDADHARAIGLFSLLGEDGRLVPGAPADAAASLSLDHDTLVRMYRGMLLIRRLDEKLLELHRAGRIGAHAEARGHEAAVIGPVAALDQDDWIVPAMRESGAALYRGLPLRSYLAQVFGNTNDVAKGRQPPAYPAAPRALRFVSTSPCAATQLPQAAGIAWAAKIRGDKTVVLAYLGEGATSAEDFHTGVNFAAVYHAPVIFLCVNNGWAVTTPAAAQSASETFAVKALAYGIPGVRVDGSDVLALHAATREAAARARRGEGPTLIEAVTYRLGGYDTSDDPTSYRDAASLKAGTAKEPLLRFRAYLLATGVLTEAQEKKLDEELEQKLHDAIEAEADVGPPDVHTMIEDVYLTPPATLEQQLADTAAGSKPR